MKNQNLRCLEGKKEVVNKRCHAEWDGGAPRTSASSTQAVLQYSQQRLQPASKMLKRVQHDFMGKRAFTLIELLVVVLIIGILAAIAVPQYNKVVEKVRLSEALIIMENVKKGVEFWLLDNGGFPDKTVELLGETTGGPAQRLDIDIEAVYSCPPGAGDGCVSPYFVYDSYCRPTKCNIIAERYHDNYSNVSYKLLMRKIPSAEGWQSYCQGFTTKGKDLCNSLSGWIADEELRE